MSFDDAGRPRGRSAAVSAAIIRLAARRVPGWMRDDLRDEWIAELMAVVHGPSDVRASRLWRGLRFACGLLRTASRIGRDLDVADSPREARRLAPTLSHVHREVEIARWMYLRSGVTAPEAPRRPRPGM